MGDIDRERAGEGERERVGVGEIVVVRDWGGVGEGGGVLTHCPPRLSGWSGSS